jgi:hypothetical protein
VGRLCPYREHEPQTLAGWQAWDVFGRGAGQLRLAPNGTGVLGLDLGALLALGIALGYEPAALAELLPAAEAGAVAGVIQRLQEESP